MASPKDNSRFFWALFLVTIVVVSIWASPFRYDYGNSGRYLVVVARRMDPRLFPGTLLSPHWPASTVYFIGRCPRLSAGPSDSRAIFSISLSG